MREKDFREAGDRIERLLEEIRSMTSPSAFQRVEECLRTTVDVYGEGLRRIVDVVATPNLSGEQVADGLLADDLVVSLLILHGLHPDDFATRVGKALERVRPYLGSHGGGIELVEADPHRRRRRRRRARPDHGRFHQGIGRGELQERLGSPRRGARAHLRRDGGGGDPRGEGSSLSPWRQRLCLSRRLPLLRFAYRGGGA